MLVPRKVYHLILPQTNIAPENKVSKKESKYFPNHHFSFGYVSFIYHVFADLVNSYLSACWMLEGTSQHNFGGAANAEMGGDRGYGTTKILVKSGELMKLKKCAVGMGPWNQQVWIHLNPSCKNQNTWIMQNSFSRHRCHQCPNGQSSRRYLKPGTVFGDSLEVTFPQFLTRRRSWE